MPRAPFFVYKSEEKRLFRVKGDRKSIGGKVQNKLNFTNKEILLKKDYLLYLTSDGFIDQNNVQRKRIGTKNLENILNQIAGLDMQEQKQILENMLDK